MHNTTTRDEIEKNLEDYLLIPMDEIEDEARLLAVRWVEKYGTMGFDIQNKHKLGSDIMNYAIRHHAKQSNFEAFAIESIKENEKVQIGEDNPDMKTINKQAYCTSCSAMTPQFDNTCYFVCMICGEQNSLLNIDGKAYPHTQQGPDPIIVKSSTSLIRGDAEKKWLRSKIPTAEHIKKWFQLLVGIGEEDMNKSIIEWLDESATDKPEELQEEVETLRSALENISTMQLNSPTEAEGRFYDCIDIAERALNKK